jgi:hypothetical protein
VDTLLTARKYLFRRVGAGRIVLKSNVRHVVGRITDLVSIIHLGGGVLHRGRKVPLTTIDRQQQEQLTL